MTRGAAPGIEADWVEPHALVVAAGSNSPHKAESPADLVERARTVVVDQLATAQLESGDLILAQAAGKFDWERSIELGSELAGTWHAPDEPGITLFESHGLAISDLAAASVVIPAARERGLPLDVPFFAQRRFEVTGCAARAPF